MTYGDAVSHEHGDGENYFISMTDMMVGMLFIFIIMLMSFALVFRQKADVQEVKTKEQHEKIEVAKDVGERLKKLEADVSRRIGQIEASGRLRTKLLHELETALTRAHLDVKVDEASGVLRLTDKAVTFKFKSSELVGPSRANVQTVAKVLADILPRYLLCVEPARPPECSAREWGSVETVFIEGHTDRQGEKTAAGRQENWRLSTERAVSTFREITGTVPKLDSLTNEQLQRILSVSAYASSRPIDDRDDIASYERNRRIDLRFVMSQDGTSGLREVQKRIEEMRREIDKLTDAPR